MPVQQFAIALVPALLHLAAPAAAPEPPATADTLRAAPTAAVASPTPDTSDTSAADTAAASAADTAGAPRWTLRFGGEARTRAEGVSNYQLGDGPELRDAYGSSRLVLGAFGTAGPLSVAVEGRHAVSHGRDLPGGRRPSDHDAWDVQTASVTAACCTAGGAGLSLTVGRQPLALGRQRLVGVSDWANARRAFDGVRADVARGPASLQLFRARPVAVEPTRLNQADSITTLTGAALDLADGVVQLYALEYDQRRLSGRHLRRTVGLRLSRAAAPSRPGFDLEGAWQGGRQDGVPVRAWFASSEASVVLPVAWKTELAAGLDAASGDPDAADARVEGFHVPFASGHSHGGYADVVGRTNAVEARLVATTSPTARLQLRAAAHRFSRLRLGDAVRSKSGAALPTAAGERSVGTELDLTTTFRVARGLRLLAGYAAFAPGAALRDAPGGARPMHWAFAGTTYQF